MEFGGRVYQQTVGIPMVTNYMYAPLVADLFRTSYVLVYICSHEMIYPAISVSTPNIYSLNKPKFNDYIDVIYPDELEIKDYRCSKIG